jgi:hypothetical protein
MRLFRFLAARFDLETYAAQGDVLLSKLGAEEDYTRSDVWAQWLISYYQNRTFDSEVANWFVGRFCAVVRNAEEAADVHSIYVSPPIFFG